MEDFGSERPVFLMYIGSVFKQLLVGKVVGAEVLILEKILIDLTEPGSMRIAFGSIHLQ